MTSAAATPPPATYKGRTLSDVEIDAVVERIGLLPLVLASLQIAGDFDAIEELPQTKRPRFSGDCSGSLPEPVAAALRSRAVEALRGWRDSGFPEPPALPERLVAQMSAFLTGKTLEAAYAPLLSEEIGLYNDPRAIVWDEPVTDAAKASHAVVIIGAGLSGLVLGYRLKQAGIPFVIMEKNEGPGGTWFENRYPGARVDVPSHCYSYSFARDHQWPELFSPAPVLKEYFHRFVADHGLAPFIRYGCAVTGATFDPAGSEWRVRTEQAGKTDEIRCRSLVGAVGQLNRPLIPPIPGAEEFQGRQFHTSRWPEDLDIAGKRVAVIGTAATALQLVPEIAPQAAQTVVFQRSPNWCFIHPEYRRTLRPEEHWAMEHIPGYAGWYRTILYNWAADGSPDHLKRDPGWPQDGRTISAANAVMRDAMTQGMREAVGGDESLLERILPDFPPGSKRPNLGDGGFYRALTRPDVELVTEGVQAFTTAGLIDGAGRHHDVDIVVYATGFRALEYLAPMTILGLDGVNINDAWRDEPGAYLGITVPGFPNFFLMYGPGTNLGYNGNLFFNAECQARYIGECLKWMIQRDLDAIEVRSEVYADYERRKDEALAGFAWALPGTTNWYKNASGKVVANSPWSMLDYWRWTRSLNLSDYKTTP